MRLPSDSLQTTYILLLEQTTFLHGSLSMVVSLNTADYSYFSGCHPLVDLYQKDVYETPFRLPSNSLQTTYRLFWEQTNFLHGSLLMVVSMNTADYSHFSGCHPLVDLHHKGVYKTPFRLPTDYFRYRQTSSTVVPRWSSV